MSVKLSLSGDTPTVLILTPGFYMVLSLYTLMIALNSLSGDTPTVLILTPGFLQGTHAHM